ncbi:g1439 [Coccomyxa elongata]
MPHPYRLHSLSDDEVTSTSGSNTSNDGDEEDTGAWVQLEMPRRSRQVTFTCNKCDGKTTRMVNPIAWDRGTVFVQCGTCEAWHNIKDAAGLIEEIRYNDSSALDDAD